VVACAGCCSLLPNGSVCRTLEGISRGMWVCFARGGCVSRAARRAVQRAYGHVREISFKPSLACRKTKRLLRPLVNCANIHDYIVVACAGCCSLLPNASECFSDVSSWYRYQWPPVGYLPLWPGRPSDPPFLTASEFSRRGSVFKTSHRPHQESPDSVCS